MRWKRLAAIPLTLRLVPKKKNWTRERKGRKWDIERQSYVTPLETIIYFLSRSITSLLLIVEGIIKNRFLKLLPLRLFSLGFLLLLFFLLPLLAHSLATSCCRQDIVCALHSEYLKQTFFFLREIFLPLLQPS